MKQTLITLGLWLICLFVFGQSFEGEIVYKTSFKSKVPDMTDQQFSSMISVGKNFYIKGGDFKYETEGTDQLWLLYINADNKLYNKFSNSDVLIWNDATVDQEEVNSIELRKSVAEILGYKCDELILNCNIGIQRYYFSSKLPVDSKLYANCLIANWYAYLSKANAIPLKIVYENTDFTMERTATAVKPMILDISIFTLPKGVKMAKSGF